MYIYTCTCICILYHKIIINRFSLCIYGLVYSYILYSSVSISTHKSNTCTCICICTCTCTC